MNDTRRDWSFASDLDAPGVQWSQRCDIAGHGDDVVASLEPSRGFDGDDRQMFLAAEVADLVAHPALWTPLLPMLPPESSTLLAPQGA
jgi:hypothetical protein